MSETYIPLFIGKQYAVRLRDKTWIYKLEKVYTKIDHDTKDYGVDLYFVNDEDGMVLHHFDLKDGWTITLID